MLHSLLSLSIFFLSTAFGCAPHNNHLAHAHLGKRQLVRSDANKAPKDWNYDHSADWATIKPEYIECQTGSHQSPINIDQQPLATTHQPTFEGYDRVMPGNFFNWDFGPAFTPHHPTDELKDLPSMTFDGQKVFMIGWHIHMPSEHLVNGTRSRGEIHLVHANEEGEESAVIGIRLEVASREENTPSRFISQLPEGQFIHYNDTTQLEGVTINHQLAIEEVGRLERYWTYTGSLTTPPCHEGLRWFLPEQPLLVSDAQMVQLLAVSRFSHRVTQEIWLHDINL